MNYLNRRLLLLCSLSSGLYAAGYFLQGRHDIAMGFALLAGLALGIFLGTAIQTTGDTK